MSTPTISGMAASIRAATESETFDLAGQTSASIEHTMSSAFATPLPLTDMIRITFVVGAGKLSRQKYDEKAMLAVTSSLKQLGFVEDRGASCVRDCAGSFKLQHDTGKNLKTVVVFPNIDSVSSNGKDANSHNQQTNGAIDAQVKSLIPKDSHGYKIAVSSLETFKNLLSTYCPTYFQKKQCLRCLDGLYHLEQSIEGKMTQGTVLDSGEQTFYDDVTELKEKMAHVQIEAGKHIEEGKLTIEERNTLLEMNEKRVNTLMKEKNSASVAEQLKKALARKQQLLALTDDMLLTSESYPPPLRYESQINSLRKKLLPLQALEETSKGRLLTLTETKSLTDKTEFEKEIERLEQLSCGWFEEDESFQKRIQLSRDRFRSKHMRAAGRAPRDHPSATSTSGRGSSGSSAPAKWILPGEKPKTGNAWNKSSIGKGKSKGAVFAAMMMDSSSDEEDDVRGHFHIAPNRLAPEKLSNKLKPVESHALLSRKNKLLFSDSSENTLEKEKTFVGDTVVGESPSISKKKKKNKKNQSICNILIPDTANEIGREIDEKETIKEITVSQSLMTFFSVLLHVIFSALSSIFSMVSRIFLNGHSGSKRKSNKKVV